MEIRCFFIATVCLFLFGCNPSHNADKESKPTICILGGTPSTKNIIDFVPDSIKTNYSFISFNRPGFGGSANKELTEEVLYQLAKDAGLKENDYGIIGISGGT